MKNNSTKRTNKINLIRLSLFVICITASFLATTSQIYAQDNWTPLDSITTTTINSITLFNADTGIAVGTGGTIFRTVNGGFDWTKIQGNSGSTTNSYSPNNILAEDHNSSRSNLSQGTAIVVGNAGTILHSKDFGFSWTTIPSGTSLNINGITNDGANYSADTVYAVGDNGLILKSSDDGLTWTKQVSGTTVNLNSVTFFNADIGVAVGNNGTILRTTNGGGLWTRISGIFNTSLPAKILTPENFNSCNSNISTILTSGFGIIVGDEGIILRTTDFGFTWSPVLTGFNSSLWGSAFKDSSLTAVGDNGIVLVSSDFGKSWQKETSRTTAQLRTVDIAVKEEGVNRLAGGSGGALFKAAPSQLNIISPSPGDIWYTGTSHTIKWSGGNPGWNVLINLGDVNTWTTYSTIYSNTLNDGNAVWNIPSTIPAGLYQIYIQEVNQQDWKYSGTFTITNLNTPCIPPPSNMVTWWDGDALSDSTALDIKGTNNGTLVNSVSIVPGKVGNSFSFDGSNYMIADSPIINGFTQLTIDMWVKPNSNYVQSQQAIAGIQTYHAIPTDATGFFTLQGTVGKVLVFRTNTASGIGETRGEGLYGVPPGKWTHIAGTYDGTVLKLYVNGMLVPNQGPNIGSTSTTASNHPIQGPVQLSGDPYLNFALATSHWRAFANDFPKYPFFGEIDEVEIFNRALSATEIQTIYNADSIGKCKPGIIIGTKFNDLNGNGVQDSGESGIPDWTIILSGSGGKNTSTTTDSLGNYFFNISSPGTYTVAEVQQPGWTSTTTVSQTVTIGSGQTMTINFGNQQANCVPPPSDMVGWWPLDETSGTTSADIAGIANTGTQFGGPVPVSGKVAGALSFDSINGYVEVADHPELNFSTGDFSIDAWILTNDSTAVATIADKRTGTNANPLGYSLYLWKGKLGFQLADNSGFTNYNTSAFVADGQWHHIAVTVTRNDLKGLRFYIDGVLVDTQNPVPHNGSLTNKGVFRIASHSYDQDTNFMFNGVVDELELFGRALTAVEVNSIWAADSLGKCKPGIIDGMKFNDLNGNGVHDSTETGISDWTINLSGPVAGSTLTDSLGNYSFDNLLPGTYTVTEVQQSGWTSTTPVSQTVTLEAGQTLTVNFGNKQGNCISPPSGMVSWWDGDAVSGTTAFDIQGTNNGTMVNNVTIVPGKVGNAFSFDGVNDYIQVGSPVVNIAPFSVDAWVNPKIIPPFPYSNNKYIVANGGETSAGYGFALLIEHQQWRFFVSDVSGMRGFAGVDIIDTNWTHLAGTWDGTANSGSIKIYVNGLLATTGTPLTSSIIGTTQNFRIGAPTQTSLYSWDGLIDEVEVFNRILDSTEVLSIYQAGSAGKCKKVTDVKESESIPEEFELMQAYPNPFNPSATIRFKIAVSGFTTLKVYDVLGRVVATLVNEVLAPGIYERTFDAKGLASGVYFYRMQTGKLVQTRKMLLMK